LEAIEDNDMRPTHNGAVIGALVAFAGVLSIGVFGFEQTPKEDERANPPHLIGSIQGPALYNAYCAVCHGTDLKGSGPMANSLKANVPDLTRIAARNLGTFPLTRVRRIISGEELLPTGHGTREMPVWGPIFSQVGPDLDLGRVRVDNLARYIREKQAQ
jgi:mono/diheme cytochrome c family protein